MTRFFPSLLAASLLLCVPALAAESLPKADEVLKKVIERARWEKQHREDDRWAGTQRSIQQKLNKEGAVEESNERHYEPVLIQGKVYSRLVARNGKPLTGDDLKKEAQREKKFRESLAKPKKPAKDDDDDDVELNEELVARYIFTVIAEEPVATRRAFVLTFLPRPGAKLTEKRRMDKVLNRLEGKVWIDAATYALVKVDMHLTEPTTLMGGLGSVRSLDFLLEMMPLASDPGTPVFLPRQLEISFEGRQLFKGMRVKQKAHFTDYRRVSELAEAK